MKRKAATVGTKVVFALALITVCVLPAGCRQPVVQPIPETIPVLSTSPASAIFPLTRRAGQRCFVDQAGRPFLLQGDAAWSLLVQLTREQAERYLEDRQRRGFNTLLVNLIEHQFATQAPRNAYGEAPFVVPGDYARPNEKYFAHVDWVLRRAAEHGLLVLLAPSYLGYGGGAEGWYREMRDSGIERLRAYGRYLGMRYRNMPHVVWMEGGDYNPPDRAPMQAIVDGLRDANPAALHSFHAKRGTAARAFLGNTAPWLDLNTIYTDEKSVVAAAIAEYTASPLPFILVEGRYEEDKGATAAVVRAQAYQAMLSGACGQVMGHKLVWPFIAGWEGALDSPGARSMTRLRALLGALQWWNLHPAPKGFVAEGAGSGAERVAAAISEDRRRAVVYIPSSRSIALDLARLGGSSVKATWIDPASAQSSTIPGPPFASTGRSVLTPPAHNSSGFGDWLLLLEATTTALTR